MMHKVKDVSVWRAAFMSLALSVCADAAEYDIAAYVWPAYQPEPRWKELGIFKAGKGEWQSVWEARPKWEGHEQPRKPLWGYENEVDPKVVEKKIDAAVSHGVNVFIYDWYWYGGRPFLEDALDKGFLGASNNGKMKFFIMWANHDVNEGWDNTVADKNRNGFVWHGTVSMDAFRTLVSRWIDRYFKRPNYYRIQGKPVLMIYDLPNFVKGLGGTDKAAEAVRCLRKACADAGLGGAHFMVCDYGLDPNVVKAVGIDSATIYNLVHWSSPKGNPDYAEWAEKAARRFDAAPHELGCSAYFAHASVGWDQNPRYPAGFTTDTVVGATPAKFEVALRRAKDWTDRNVAPDMPKLITINSWNEWTEGSYLEPDERWGLGYLEAVRRVFSSGSDCPQTLTLEEGFRNPPNSAKPHTWYHMMNGNVTKEGITCDFEALAKAGIGGVQMFDAGCNIPPGPLHFNSPEWFDMFKYAAAEARRLGLEICIPNCSGWSSSGGPWNQPSNGMKCVTWREVKTSGPSKFHAQLPRDKKDHGFYEDIAVVAFPTPPAEARTYPEVKTTVVGNSFLLSSGKPFTAPAVMFQITYGHVWNGDAVVDVETSADGKSFTHLESFCIPIMRSGEGNHGERFHTFPAPVTARAIRLTFSKSPVALRLLAARPEARAKLSNLAAKTFAVRQECALDTTSAQSDQIVPKGDVRDITAHLAPDGTLDWNVPTGDWTIVRIGYLCNGRCNHPASDHGRGLEVDKLSASAMDYHFNQYVTRLCKHLGSLAGAVESGFNNILVDSYEVGSQNWTQDFDKTFEARMGYSLRPYLPVFAGRVVGSVDESERFLEDFRRVVADLFAENYAGRLAELCHQHGLLLSVEPYGSAPCDNLQYGQDVDVPMGEFWSFALSGNHGMGACNAHFAACLAHVWGRRYAATESFSASPSGGGRWVTTPFSIKAQGDGVYCEGINRIIYHRFTHQPWPGNKYLPGMTMGRWGMHLDRTQTWWESSGPWFRYQTRCQWMLQEGTFVADALFFCGEQAPNQGGVTDVSTDVFANDMKLPVGYKWDVCATKVLKMLKVVDGCVVAPGGVAYRLLVLPPRKTMSEDLLHTVDGLLDAGANVCGMVKPVRAPGLCGYPTADGRVSDLAEKVWAKGVLTCRPAEALQQLGVAPDFISTATAPAPQWIHRRGNGADWYFVALNNEQTRTFEASFRQTGRMPEIWDAETGAVRPADVWREADGRTYVTLTFPPSGSAFVVFRAPAMARHAVNVVVTATPRPDPVEAESSHKLTIDKALYGVFAAPTRPDCAEVSSSLKPGERVCVQSNAFGGDPAPMQYKKLEVKYVLDGHEKCDVVKEHDSYTLPVGAQLKSAWYGVIDPKWNPAEESVVDITKKVAAKVKDGTISVRIDNALAGRDPMCLTKKAARITYTYDGVTRTDTLSENSLFNVPHVAEPLDVPPVWTWSDGRILAWQPLSAEVTSASGAVTHYTAEPPAPILVGGAWNVAFPEGWDAPASVMFPRLVSWTARPEDGVKYFSGTATYTKRVSMPLLPQGARLVLDLGDVKNFAEVTVNGKTYPVLWKPPFRVDVTDAFAGSSTLDLSIRVTNLWPNRLIGDDLLCANDCEWKGSVLNGVKEIGIKELPQWVKAGKASPTGRHTFTTWKHWDKYDELLPSGLLGPVLLRIGEFVR